MPHKMDDAIFLFFQLRMGTKFQAGGDFIAWYATAASEDAHAGRATNGKNPQRGILTGKSKEAVLKTNSETTSFLCFIVYF